MAGAAGGRGRSGDVLNRTYTLHELVCSDDTSELYRATDRRDDSQVVVKLLRPEFALQAKVAESFVRGPRGLCELDHPNFGRVLAIEADETGIPFVVEEPPEGQPLAGLLSQFPDGLPLGLAFNLLLPVVEAVAAAHARGIAVGPIHLDRVVLSGSGASTVPRVMSCGASALTRRGVAAVLRARGEEPADPRADVLGLGQVLFEMLTGLPSPPGSDHEGALDEAAPHVPHELAELVEACLARDPARRPADAGEVAEGLRGLRQRIGGTRGASPAPGPREPSTAPSCVSHSTPLSAPGPASADPALAATLADSPAAQPRVDPIADTGVMDGGLAATLPAAGSAPEGSAQVEAVGEGSDGGLDRALSSFGPLPSSLPSLPAVPSLPALPGGDGAAALPVASPPALTGPPTKKRAPKGKKRKRLRKEDELAEASPADALAAAFGPLEGVDRIGQSETRGNAAAREWRKRMRDQEREAERRRGAARRTGAATAGGDASAEVGPIAQMTRKALRQRVRIGAVLGQTQLDHLKRVGQDKGAGRRRAAGYLVFLAFAVGLLLCLPSLLDPTRREAAALLGGKAGGVIGGLALASVIALVQVWTLQLRSRPPLLRPVIWSLKVVCVSLCVLSVGYLVPSFGLGPIEAAARRALPWTTAAFFLSLSLFGLLRAVRDSASRVLTGVAVALLSVGSLFGSYRGVALGLAEVSRPRAGLGQAMLDSDDEAWTEVLGADGGVEAGLEGEGFERIMPVETRQAPGQPAPAPYEQP